MAKKWFIWLALLVYVMSVSNSVSADEKHTGQVVVMEYRGPCPHELCSYGQTVSTGSSASEFMTDDAEYVAASCIYCNRVYKIRIAGQLIHGKQREAEACTHDFYKLDDVLEQGWYPAGKANASIGNKQIVNHSPFHEYRTYYMCQCAYCDTTIRMYEGQLVNGRTLERHSYAPIENTLVHAHLPGENRHVFLRTCEVCGYCEAVTEGCGQLENGLCTTMLKTLLREQGCENHNEKERLTCPRCK